MILRLRYVQRFRDRHGTWRYYLRRRGRKAVPLPDPAEPGFQAAYMAALAVDETAEPRSKILPGSLGAVAAGYMASPAFLNLRPSTQTVYRRLINGLLREHADKPAQLLTSDAVGRLIGRRQSAPAAANHLLRTLRALMRHAVVMGLRSDDPTRQVQRLRERARGAATWTETDIEAFEAHWPIGSRPRLALALMLYTGQRRSDVVRMGRQHVRGGGIDVRQVKTGVELFIPLHPELAEILAREGRDRLTFLVTERGVPFTPNGFYMRFREWVRAAGLPDGRSPHGLRKAAARRMAEAGCTAHQIAAITGHKTLAEVQRYTRAADQRRLAEDAVRHLGRPGRTNHSRKTVKPAAKSLK